MFEDSLVESQVATLSPTRRWTMAGSIAVQLAAAAVLIALPLMHPERLRFHASTPLVFTPPPPPPPVSRTRTEPYTCEEPSPMNLPTIAQVINPLPIAGPGPTAEEPLRIDNIIS